MAVASVWRDPQTKALPPAVGPESMRDRIGVVRGELEIVSLRGHGTVVRRTVSAAARGFDELGEWET